MGTERFSFYGLSGCAYRRVIPVLKITCNAVFASGFKRRFNTRYVCPNGLGNENRLNTPSLTASVQVSPKNHSRLTLR